MFLLTYAKLQFLSQKNKIIFSGRLLFELLQKSLVCPKQCINFFRLNLDYADIIYVKSFKKSIKKKLDALQHNARLIITGVNFPGMTLL